MVRFGRICGLQISANDEQPFPRPLYYKCAKILGDYTKN